MYNKKKATRTSFQINGSVKGETIEKKMRRILNSNEPISDGAPLIYTERKDGVLPEYDIRTDRFEIAVEGMDMVTKSLLAKRNKFVQDLSKANDGNGAVDSTANNSQSNSSGIKTD